MRIEVFFLLLVLNATGQTHKTILPGGSTLNFTVNLNNIQEARATNSSISSAPQETHIHTDSPLLNKLAQLWVDPNASLSKRLGSHAGSYIWNNKWRIVGSALLLGYLYACYSVITGNNYLAQKDLWSSWRPDLTLEELLAIPQAQLSKELLQEIQRRYTDPAAVTDLLRPLNSFLLALDKEEEQLRAYQSLYSWLEYTRASKIIVASTIQFSRIESRLQRLAYIKNIFHSWAAQYQLEHAKIRSGIIELAVPDVQDIATIEWYRYQLLIHTYWLSRKEKILF